MCGHDYVVTSMARSSNGRTFGSQPKNRRSLLLRVTSHLDNKMRISYSSHMLCVTCKEDKDPDNFNWKNKAKGVKQGYCRDCKKQHQKKYYHANKKAYLETIYRGRAERRKEYLSKIKEYLESHPCVDCGNHDIRVLHFDHMRDKESNVMEMVYHCASWEKIEDEIAKCEVRCANCHMIKTWPHRLSE